MAPRTAISATTEVWQLCAALEAAIIIVLLIGWIGSHGKQPSTPLEPES